MRQLVLCMVHTRKVDFSQRAIEKLSFCTFLLFLLLYCFIEANIIIRQSNRKKEKAVGSFPIPLLPSLNIIIYPRGLYIHQTAQSVDLCLSGDRYSLSMVRLFLFSEAFLFFPYVFGFLSPLCPTISQISSSVLFSVQPYCYVDVVARSPLV